MDMRLRFAPSPTGNVHIGNIRTAIYNWLYARHCNGKFLLRIEDTDRERSTQAAIDTLLESMEWLGLDYDEEIFYQSSRADAHRSEAEKLLSSGKAWRKPGEQGKPGPVLFLIPWNTDGIQNLRDDGDAQIDLSPTFPVKLSQDGISFAVPTSKGKVNEQNASLAGFRGLNILDASGGCLFDLENSIAEIMEGGRTFTVENPAKFVFRRRSVFFKDIIKGELAKPLDSMKDLIIVRSDGNPVFHFANVCDDVEQRVTHIIRGDDHVENTYRHIFLFHALGRPVPVYGHMPMIVNQSGKPYSKRDGDAYIGDFRTKGFLPEALFNYLSLLGWSPGDDREKMTRSEMIEAFTIERVKSSSAQFDINKLMNMNGMYISEMDPAKFAESVLAFAPEGARAPEAKEYFAKVARLMQSRTKNLAQAAEWGYFFSEAFDRDEKAFRKFVDTDQTKAAISKLSEKLAEISAWNLAEIEKCIHSVETEAGISEGKLNQPLRVILTGKPVGAGIYETMELLGREKTIERLGNA